MIGSVRFSFPVPRWPMFSPWFATMIGTANSTGQRWSIQLSFSEAARRNASWYATFERCSSRPNCSIVNLAFDPSNWMRRWYSIAQSTRLEEWRVHDKA
jgi:hypothetical protein